MRASAFCFPQNPARPATARYHEHMAKNGPQVKQLRLDLRHRSGRRKLEKYLADGWEIAGNQTRGLLNTWPGYSDVTLIKN